MDSFVDLVAFKKAGWCVTAQGDVEGKIMSQKSSIVRLLTAKVFVFVLGSLSGVSVFVFRSSSRSGWPCLSNGPNC